MFLYSKNTWITRLPPHLCLCLLSFSKLPVYSFLLSFDVGIWVYFLKPWDSLMSVFNFMLTSLCCAHNSKSKLKIKIPSKKALANLGILCSYQILLLKIIWNSDFFKQTFHFSSNLIWNLNFLFIFLLRVPVMKWYLSFLWKLFYHSTKYFFNSFQFCLAIKSEMVYISLCY